MSTEETKRIMEFCDTEFVRWFATRGKYFNFKQANVLAQFMPSKSGIEKDYPVSPFCNFFNAALQLELDRSPIKTTCFLFVYFKHFKPKTLKAYVHEDLQDSISMATAIRYAHEAATKIDNMATLNLRMQAMINGGDDWYFNNQLSYQKRANE